MAAEFLHHVAYVNLDESPSYNERVERYDVMGDLYHQLKFHRKSSFFKRVAAMHCVSPVLPSPAWSECYDLLLQAFPGFKMSFNPSDYRQPGRLSGWPGIRLRVFQELIYAARQLGNSAVTARHVSLCLHTMFDCMFSKEIVDLVHLLETCTRLRFDEGLPVTTSTGLILPPVPFSSFPLFSYFEVLKLTPQLEPHKLKQVLPNNSVFIYSPMNFNRKLSRSQSVAEYEFCWVSGDTGSVEVTLYNPLPLELRITDLSLIVEGVKFKSYPSSHTLPPESGPHSINIMGTPRSRGTLRILGYQMTLFGVLSRCLFSELSHIKQNVLIVEVAPVLPSLHIFSELPKSPYMVTGGDNTALTSAILQIYVGEQRECHIKLKNNGLETITNIDVALWSDKYQDILDRILTLDTHSLEKSLPLLPASEALLAIKTIGSMKLSDLPEGSLMSPHSDTEGKHRASSAVANTVKLIESQLKIAYTGEEAAKLHYHRECIMAVDTVLIPSINILTQSVQSVASETCHVLYEVFNESNMALDIKSPDTSMSLKPMQSGWVYCKVEKCDSCSSLEFCKKVINDNARLSWSSVNQKSGLVSSDRFEWDDAELDKVRRRPFVVTKFSFTDIEFHLTIFQEISSKRIDVEVDSSFVYIGPSTHFVPQFSGGETAEVNLTIAIFYSGQYVLECQCVCGDGEPISDIDPGLSISVT